MKADARDKGSKVQQWGDGKDLGVVFVTLAQLGRFCQNSHYAPATGEEAPYPNWA